MMDRLRDQIIKHERKLLMRSIPRDRLTQGLASSFLSDWPHPEWLKSVHRDGNLVKFTLDMHNEAYTRVFGVPLSQYRGKEDSAAWLSSRDVQAFRDLDMRALETGCVVLDYEFATPVDGGPRLGGLVRKWPVRDEAGEIRWIRGRCYKWKRDTPGWRLYCQVKRFFMSIEPWKRALAPADWRERSIIARTILQVDARHRPLAKSARQ